MYSSFKFLLGQGQNGSVGCDDTLPIGGSRIISAPHGLWTPLGVTLNTQLRVIPKSCQVCYQQSYTRKPRSGNWFWLCNFIGLETTPVCLCFGWQLPRWYTSIWRHGACLFHAWAQQPAGHGCWGHRKALGGACQRSDAVSYSCKIHTPLWHYLSAHGTLLLSTRLWNIKAALRLCAPDRKSHIHIHSMRSGLKSGIGDGESSWGSCSWCLCNLCNER